jgi:hypothetical protein
MSALQRMNENLSPRAPEQSTTAIAPERPLSADRPAEAPAPVTAQFLPLDPDIVSEAIPAFFIGRNKEGFWVARDANGRLGGIFLLESSALSFARRNSSTGCAAIFPSGNVELDLENEGNPIVALLGGIMRLTRRPLQRTAASIGKITEAVEQRLRGRYRPRGEAIARQETGA